MNLKRKKAFLSAFSIVYIQIYILVYLHVHVYFVNLLATTHGFFNVGRVSVAAFSPALFEEKLGEERCSLCRAE